MKIIPTVGMAIISEDKRDFANASIEVPEYMMKGVSTQGKIVAVSNLLSDDPQLYFEALQKLCPWVNDSNIVDQSQRNDLMQFCARMERGHDKTPFYREGDHVVFSKFTEQIIIYENGKETIYYSVPVQAILGILCEE